MGLDTPLYALRTALANLKRNAVMSGFAIATTALMLLMLAAFVFASRSLSTSVDALQSRVNLMVYLQEGVSPEASRALAERLRGDPQVAAAEFVSKDEALARLQRQLAANPELLEGVSENPLPEGYEVRLRDAAYAGELADSLRSAAGVDLVVYHSDVARRLVAITRALDVAGVAMVSALAVLAIFIIVNTIRLGLAARRQEIELMKLIGATNWFIRWPFVIEGIICGLAGATLVAITVAVAYTPALQAVGGLLDFLPLAFDPGFGVKLIGGTLLLGLLLGGAGSYLSIHRFLRV